MTHEIEILKRKYQAALNSLTGASDTIFALDAELSIIKERIKRAEEERSRLEAAAKAGDGA